MSFFGRVGGSNIIFSTDGLANVQTRWWFELFSLFSPRKLFGGRSPILDDFFSAYFSDGLVPLNSTQPTNLSSSNLKKWGSQFFAPLFFSKTPIPELNMEDLIVGDISVRKGWRMRWERRWIFNFVMTVVVGCSNLTFKRLST